jgi:4,5-DOPA dioxygenase extradiol
LRDEGVLVLCSGNIVHNLRMLGGGATPDWARDFDEYVRAAIVAGDSSALIAYEGAGASWRHAVPSNEHYLPLLYAAGMRRAGDKVRFFTESFDLASIGMRSVQFA